uniref:Uncharacterized protein n=1 Tax=Utricularia reniformis TaxID=192314 RepID=A0A1Y0B1N0_9LAMI|nr:hypothetical protein AEK19_MT1069 [Utricularia reniformis]ART31291.1 hypothetical protein AEK19_MT1069 [Utricularia reniformis]
MFLVNKRDSENRVVVLLFLSFELRKYVRESYLFKWTGPLTFLPKKEEGLLYLFNPVFQYRIKEVFFAIEFLISWVHDILNSIPKEQPNSDRNYLSIESETTAKGYLIKGAFSNLFS